MERRLTFVAALLWFLGLSSAYILAAAFALRLAGAVARKNEKGGTSDAWS
jgi:hypothetical protein